MTAEDNGRSRTGANRCQARMAHAWGARVLTISNRDLRPGIVRWTAVHGVGKLSTRMRRIESMKIRSLRCYAVELPAVGHGYTMSRGRHLAAFQSTIVRLDGEDGTAGYGETCTLGSNYIDAFPSGVQSAIG